MAAAKFNIAEAIACLEAAKQAGAASEDPPKKKRKSGSPATKDDGAALGLEAGVKTEQGPSGDEAKNPAAAPSASASAAAASSAGVAAASSASDGDDPLHLKTLFGPGSDEEDKPLTALTSEDKGPAADGSDKAAPPKPVKAKAKPKIKPHKAVAAAKEDPAGLPADEKDQEMERPWEVGDIVKVSCKKDAKNTTISKGRCSHICAPKII